MTITSLSIVPSTLTGYFYGGADYTTLPGCKKIFRHFHSLSYYALDMAFNFLGMTFPEGGGP
jgi:hypothetical protein